MWKTCDIMANNFNVFEGTNNHLMTTLLAFQVPTHIHCMRHASETHEPAYFSKVIFKNVKPKLSMYYHAEKFCLLITEAKSEKIEVNSAVKLVLQHRVR